MSNGSASNDCCDCRGSSGWIGWFVAAVLLLVSLMKLAVDKFEIRPKRSKRHMMVQGPVTYKIKKKDGEPDDHGRYTLLAASDFGAWCYE